MGMIVDDQVKQAARLSAAEFSWFCQFSVITVSESWLLMAWLLVLPGHQRLLYWLCRTDGSFYLPWGRISSICVVSVLRNDINTNMIYAFENKFSMMVVYSLWPNDSMMSLENINIDAVISCCLITPSHYMIHSWLIISEIPRTEISQKNIKISIIDISLNIINMILLSHPPGANELMTMELHDILLPQ